jgi:hypothetical protein
MSSTLPLPLSPYYDIKAHVPSKSVIVIVCVVMQKFSRLSLLTSVLKEKRCPEPS